MDVEEAFRQRCNDGDQTIIARLRSDYDTKNDPDKLLARAAFYGRNKVLEACLAAGIHFDMHGALCNACGNGEIGPIKILVRAGADVNSECEFGGTPLGRSAGRGKLNEVRYLLEQGARLGTGILSAAVFGEYPKVVEFLISQGADLEEYGDGGGLTPLTAASHRGHQKGHTIALLLINAGANVNYVRKSDEMTPLKFAAASATPEVVQALIDHGAEVDGPPGTTLTALMMAARANNVPALDVLLRNGANPALPCGLPWAEGRTAEGLAELENRRDAFEFLRTMRLGGS